MTLVPLGAIFGYWPCASVLDDSPAGTPDVLLIVADDLGYSDLGCSSGLLASHPYASSTCSPSRAMLLTETDNHIAGLGNMDEWLGPKQKVRSGYEGHVAPMTARAVAILAKQRGQGCDAVVEVQGLNPAPPKLTIARNGKKMSDLPESYYSSGRFTNHHQPQ